jgi:hypothetical protein
MMLPQHAKAGAEEERDAEKVEARGPEEVTADRPAWDDAGDESGQEQDARRDRPENRPACGGHF